MAELNWTDAQWQKVNGAVTEAFNKASVATALLQSYGPLAESVESVRDEELTFTPEDVTVKVSDDTTLKLFNLRVSVLLSNEQVADESLSSALLAFRRAANTLAQVEDDIVFNGYDEPGEGRRVRGHLPGQPDQLLRNVVANKPASLTGLVHSQGTVEQIRKSKERGLGETPGEHVIGEIAKAVVDLEAEFHPGPFACVLGARLFQQYKRQNSACCPPTASGLSSMDRCCDPAEWRI